MVSHGFYVFRVSFKVLCIRVPYYFGDLNSDLALL